MPVNPDDLAMEPRPRCCLCGEPNDPAGNCTIKEGHDLETQWAFGPASTHQDAIAKTRAFLKVNQERPRPDTEPMWMTGGICITWGDLRRLAECDSET